MFARILLIGLVALFAGCGSNEPTVIEHRVVIENTTPEKTPEQLEMAEANQVFGLAVAEYTRLSTEAREIGGEVGLQFVMATAANESGPEKTYERMKAEEGYLAAATWLLAQYKGKTPQQVIAEHPED